MRPPLRFGTLRGIEIGLHYSWLALAALVTLSLVGAFHVVAPSWSPPLVWTLAALTALLFFGSLLLHELSHAAVARLRGVPVRSLTLFGLGGVAQIGKDAAEPRTEFWMGAVGPVVSAALGLGCLMLSELFAPAAPGAPEPAELVLRWLGTLNLGLATLNLLPGFPLDGGRLLRAAIWRSTGDQARATRVSARAGQLVANGLILLGLARAFSGRGFDGLWLAFIGWFLLEAAAASYAQLEAEEGLRGAQVADIMTRDYPVVDRTEDLRTFVNDYLLRSGRHCFVVREDGRLAGIITPHEVKTVPPSRWPETPVGSVMRRAGEVRTVSPETRVSEALEVMGREDVNQLPVVRQGRVEGLLSRGQVLALMQDRAEVQA